MPTFIHGLTANSNGEISVKSWLPPQINSAQLYSNDVIADRPTWQPARPQTRSRSRASSPGHAAAQCSDARPPVCVGFLTWAKLGTSAHDYDIFVTDYFALVVMEPRQDRCGSALVTPGASQINRAQSEQRLVVNGATGFDAKVLLKTSKSACRSAVRLRHRLGLDQSFYLSAAFALCECRLNRFWAPRPCSADRSAWLLQTQSSTEPSLR